MGHSVFTITQLTLGSPLIWEPAVGTEAHDLLVDAYIPGPASLQQKRATIALDFFDTAAASTMPAPFCRTYLVATPQQGEFAQPQQQNYSPVFTAGTSFSPSTYASSTPSSSFSAPTPSASSSSSSKSSKRSLASPPSASPAKRLPGFSIMTKDGVDITNNQARGPKTKAQREQAARMRKLGACPSCKRSKQKCEPSHHRPAGKPSGASSASSVGSPWNSSASASASASTSPGSRASISPQSSFGNSFSPALPAPMVAPFDASFATTESQGGDWGFTLDQPLADHCNAPLLDFASADLFDFDAAFDADLAFAPTFNEPVQSDYGFAQRPNMQSSRVDGGVWYDDFVLSSYIGDSNASLSTHASSSELSAVEMSASTSMSSTQSSASHVPGTLGGERGITPWYSPGSGTGDGGRSSLDDVNAQNHVPDYNLDASDGYFGSGDTFTTLRQPDSPEVKRHKTLQRSGEDGKSIIASSNHKPIAASEDDMHQDAYDAGDNGHDPYTNSMSTTATPRRARRGASETVPSHDSVGPSSPVDRNTSGYEFSTPRTARAQEDENRNSVSADPSRLPDQAPTWFLDKPTMRAWLDGEKPSSTLATSKSCLVQQVPDGQLVDSRAVAAARGSLAADATAQISPHESIHDEISDWNATVNLLMASTPTPRASRANDTTADLRRIKALLTAPAPAATADLHPFSGRDGRMSSSPASTWLESNASTVAAGKRPEWTRAQRASALRAAVDATFVPTPASATHASASYTSHIHASATHTPTSPTHIPTTHTTSGPTLPLQTAATSRAWHLLRPSVRDLTSRSAVLDETSRAVEMGGRLRDGDGDTDWRGERVMATAKDRARDGLQRHLRATIATRAVVATDAIKDTSTIARNARNATKAAVAINGTKTTLATIGTNSSTHTTTSTRTSPRNDANSTTTARLGAAESPTPAPTVATRSPLLSAPQLRTTVRGGHAQALPRGGVTGIIATRDGLDINAKTRVLAGETVRTNATVPLSGGLKQAIRTSATVLVADTRSSSGEAIHTSATASVSDTSSSSCSPSATLPVGGVEPTASCDEDASAIAPAKVEVLSPTTPVPTPATTHTTTPTPTQTSQQTWLPPISSLWQKSSSGLWGDVVAVLRRSIRSRVVHEGVEGLVGRMGGLRVGVV